MESEEQQPVEKPAKGYGKRPLWQWVVIYLIVGGLVYFAIYYFFLRGGSSGLGY